MGVTLTSDSMTLEMFSAVHTQMMNFVASFVEIAPLSKEISHQTEQMVLTDGRRTRKYYAERQIKRTLSERMANSLSLHRCRMSDHWDATGHHQRPTTDVERRA